MNWRKEKKRGKRLERKRVIPVSVLVPPIAEHEQAGLPSPHSGFMTEDEYDIIQMNRQRGERLIPLDEVLRESGYKLVRIQGKSKLVRSRRLQSASDESA